MVPVLLHGLNESSFMWQGWMSKPGFGNSVRVDFPGFGGQGIPEGFDFSISSYAQWLQEQLKGMAGPFLLIGHSMGGYIALEYLNRYPEQVGGVVLVNSYASADNQTRKQHRNQAIEMLSKNPTAYFRLFSEALFYPEPGWLKRPEGRMFYRQLSALKPSVIQEVLKGLMDRLCHRETVLKWNSNIHYIFGSEDKMLEADMLQQEANQLGARQTCIPGKGHMLPWQASELVQSYILSQFELPAHKALPLHP